MKVEDIHVAHSRLSDRVYAGRLSSSLQAWEEKKDITNDFITAALSYFKEAKIITDEAGNKYEVSVKAQKGATDD